MFFMLTRKYRKNRKSLHQRKCARRNKNETGNTEDRSVDRRHQLDSQPIESPPSEQHSDAIVVFLEGKGPQRGPDG